MVIPVVKISSVRLLQFHNFIYVMAVCFGENYLVTGWA